MDKLSLGFSPCPNDTFMMYGLLHGKVETSGLGFNSTIMDVEELNHAAFNERFDVTKLSFKTYYEVCHAYELLTAGAALGRGNGPLLIYDGDAEIVDIPNMRIAVPGMNTTATFLLKFAFPTHGELVPMLFSDIEDAVRDKIVDAGVIIHETRFMYAQRGFTLMADLGTIWETRTQLPIPLGCFAVKKSIDDNIKRQLSHLIRRSIQFAETDYPSVLPYVKAHAQELSEEVIKKHINMFVNAHSKDLGPTGLHAVAYLFEELNAQSKQFKKIQYI